MFAIRLMMHLRLHLHWHMSVMAFRPLLHPSTIMFGDVSRFEWIVYMFEYGEISTSSSFPLPHKRPTFSISPTLRPKRCEMLNLLVRGRGTLSVTLEPQKPWIQTFVSWIPGSQGFLCCRYRGMMYQVSFHMEVYHWLKKWGGRTLRHTCPLHEFVPNISI